MKELRITLIGDGSSDKILLTITKWLLDDLYPQLPVYLEFADFRFLKNPPSKSNPNVQISEARKYFPFDILLYHRDAETTAISSVELRKQEVLTTLSPEDLEISVCVVPVKMMETWLLIDETAIKKASGNRNYKQEIALPPINRLENESNPKNLLHEFIRNASGLSGRNLKKINVNKAVHLVADYITDFNILRQLNAFKIFENDLKKVVDKIIQHD